MTLPYERREAVRAARQFMFALLDPKQTPRVPRAVRLRAARCLRHFPGDADMMMDLNNTFGSAPKRDEGDQ